MTTQLDSYLSILVSSLLIAIISTKQRKEEEWKMLTSQKEYEKKPIYQNINMICLLD